MRIQETPELSEQGFGRSWLGTPLTYLKAGRGEKLLFFVTGLHPEEEYLAESFRKWTRDLREALHGNGILGDCDLKVLLNRCTLCIFPCLNPDGIKIRKEGLPTNHPLRERVLRQTGNPDFSTWEGNLRGVRLDQNFNVNWRENKQKDPDGAYGEFPESEPEVRAFCITVRQRKPAAIFLASRGERQITLFEDCTGPVRECASFLRRYSGYPLRTEPWNGSGCGEWALERGTVTMRFSTGPEVNTDPARYRTWRDLLTITAGTV